MLSGIWPHAHRSPALLPNNSHGKPDEAEWQPGPPKSSCNAHGIWPGFLWPERKRINASKEAVEIPVEVRATPPEVLERVSGHECRTWASQTGKVRMRVNFGLNCRLLETQSVSVFQRKTGWEFANREPKASLFVMECDEELSPSSSNLCRWRLVQRM